MLNRGCSCEKAFTFFMLGFSSFIKLHATGTTRFACLRCARTTSRMKDATNLRELTLKSVFHGWVSGRDNKGGYIGILHVLNASV